MSETMKPISFEKIINMCLEDYYTKGKIFEIDEKNFYRDKNEKIGMNFNNQFLRFPIGPAAGPHTQLCQSILTAYLAGARFFEVKTVQVVDGKQMQQMISKPCIDVKNVGYNVEWSTELTVEEAKSEYIKASILCQVFGIELGLSDAKDFVINISVGYDLEGIKSKKITDFIEDLKDARNTEIFKECIDVLKKNIHKFRIFKLEDIDKISPNITNTVTLSTMHGSKPEEIYSIASYLMIDRKLNTFIKCNPTLLGYENVRKIFDDLGYNDIAIRKEDFEKDLQFADAVDMISKLINLGKENDLTFGIKLTNTLPVINSRDELSGEVMYLSGKPLYPITIGVANMFAEVFDGNICMSFSGGIDANNIVEILKTGISPITFSTILLKPRGFINIKMLLDKISKEKFSFNKIDVESLKELAQFSKTDDNYKNKGDGEILEDTLTTFDCFKVNCGLCVDVCPNRANARIYDKHFNTPYQILHFDSRCNECGNCHTFCTKGGYPYFAKATLYSEVEEFNNSKNPGFVRVEENKFKIRDENGNIYEYEPDLDKLDEGKKEIEIFLETVIRDYLYLI